MAKVKEFYFNQLEGLTTALEEGLQPEEIFMRIEDLPQDNFEHSEELDNWIDDYFSEYYEGQVKQLEILKKRGA